MRVRGLNTKWVLKFTLTVLSLGLFLKAPSCLALEGVPYIDFKIHEKVYHVPIPNKEVKEDFFMLKRALAGDEVSRDILLGGKDKRWLFIGDLTPLWCVITADDIVVMNPTKKEY